MKIADVFGSRWGLEVRRHKANSIQMQQLIAWLVGGVYTCVCVCARVFVLACMFAYVSVFVRVCFRVLLKRHCRKGCEGI